jgi:hypothetical protein
MTDERRPIVLRLEPELLRKVERLTRKERKGHGRSWSRNDQISLMVRYYEPPELDKPENF